MYARVLLSVLFLVPSVMAETAVEGEYLLRFRTNSSAQTQSLALFNLGVVQLQYSELTETSLVRAYGSVDDQYRKELLASGVVEFLEPNYIYQALRTPNDSDFEALWGLNNTGQTGGTSNIDIDAPEAWDLTTGGEEIIVGVIDTGVDYLHPELAENVWTNPDEIPGNGIDDDGNGVIDDIHGFNAVLDTGNAIDDNGHGTHVAGIIASQGNNSRGVSGVSWNTKILPLKFLDAAGFGSTQNAIEAIEYAVQMKRRGANIRVLNNSWGGRSRSQALEEAIRLAEQEGILFVAAAGNNGGDNDRNPIFPASYSGGNVLSVAAVDASGNLAGFSNYGERSVDLAAPGVSILSLSLNGQYRSLSGTSMAAPYASGVAALVLSRELALTSVELKNRLEATSKPLATLNGVVSSGGLLNAYRALTSSSTPPPPSTPEFRYRSRQGSANYQSSIGRLITQADDAYAEVSLPFAFSYFGEETLRLALSTNGRVLPLREGDSVPTEADYQGGPSAGILVLHADLMAADDPRGGLWYSADESSARITWISKFFGNRFSDDPAHTIVTQLVLTASGSMQLHYQKLGASPFIESVTIGAVSLSGQAGEDLLIDNGRDDLLRSGQALYISANLGRGVNDFDGDGRSDVVVWRPSNGTWYVLPSSANFAFESHFSVQHGLPGDIPLRGDFDGDQRADYAVWRPSNGTWYLRQSRSEYTRLAAIQWGLPTDKPIVGDFDGDGAHDLTVYRPSEGTFYMLFSSGGFNRTGALNGLQTSSNSYFRVVALGGTDYDALAADVVGNGRDELLTVWKPARFWSVKDASGNLLSTRPWGEATDQVYSCDWDMDSKSDRVIVRPAGDGLLDWFVAAESGAVFIERFGLYGDLVDCGSDYDGDGKVDKRSFRIPQGNWFIQNSSSGETEVKQFGLPGDIPL